NKHMLGHGRGLLAQVDPMFLQQTQGRACRTPPGSQSGACLHRVARESGGATCLLPEARPASGSVFTKQTFSDYYPSSCYVLSLIGMALANFLTPALLLSKGI